MNRGRLQRVTKLLVLLQLLLGLAPGGVNLCVAADGHVALEFSHAELPCVRDFERHHPEATVFDAHEFAHHACEDVPLLESRPYRTSGTVKLGAPPLVVLPAPLLAAPAAPGALLGAGTSPYAALELAARAVRSVILLV